VKQWEEEDQRLIGRALSRLREKNVGFLLGIDMQMSGDDFR